MAIVRPSTFELSTHRRGNNHRRHDYSCITISTIFIRFRATRRGVWLWCDGVSAGTRHPLSRSGWWVL